MNVQNDTDDIEATSQIDSLNSKEKLLTGNTDLPLIKINQIDDSEHDRAKEYHTIRLRLRLISEIAIPLVLIFLWILGMDDWFANFTGTTFSFQSVFLMFTLLTLLIVVISLPLDIYSNILERKYGFSTQTWGQWIKDNLKQLFLQIILMGTAISALYIAIDEFPDTWWIYGFIGSFIFISFVQAISPIILIPLFMKLEPFPQGELRQRIEALAQKMDLNYKDIYLLKMSQQTTKANAMVTGFGNTIRVVLGDTLVQNFRPDEIEVVMAHEISHQKHKDVYRLVAFFGFIMLITFFLINFGFQTIVDVFNYNSKSDPRTLFFFMISFSLVMFFFQPISNYFSRTREKAADLAAIRELQDLNIYESAFTRLAQQNLAYLFPSKLEVLFNYSHPPILERISYAKAELKQT